MKNSKKNRSIKGISLVTSISMAIVLAFGLSACSSTKTTTSDSKISTESQNTKQPSGTSMQSVSPGQIMIVGSIVAISPIVNTSATGPCSKVPCVATVKVDSVLGYGSATTPLVIGKNITLHFVFTLSPTTKELFPNMDERLPGLAAGDSFTGSIQSRGDDSFLIYNYVKSSK